MQRGYSVDRAKDRALFRRTADMTHRFNVQAKPMRLGIRL